MEGQDLQTCAQLTHQHVQNSQTGATVTRARLRLAGGMTYCMGVFNNWIKIAVMFAVRWWLVELPDSFPILQLSKNHAVIWSEQPLQGALKVSALLQDLSRCTHCHRCMLVSTSIS